jgi:hypothetical protein
MKKEVDVWEFAYLGAVAIFMISSCASRSLWVSVSPKSLHLRTAVDESEGDIPIIICKKIEDHIDGAVMRNRRESPVPVISRKLYNHAERV